MNMKLYTELKLLDHRDYNAIYELTWKLSYKVSILY